MDPALSPLDVGLHMLHERRRVLGKAEPPGAEVQAKISEQIALAQAPWSDTLATLASFPDTVTILDQLYGRVLPYLIKGYENSAVHHTAYTVSFMARIAVAELRGPEVKRGVVAALLHDIGSGDSFLPKITEARIRRAAESARDRLRAEGIRYRREHMEKGVAISRQLLETYQLQHPHAITAEDRAVILDIVGTHDNCKIPLMEATVNKAWLLRCDPQEWIKQCHWESDALWMLCPAGILIDLEREHEADTPQNRKAKFMSNLGLHARIVDLYRRAHSEQEMEQFAFRDGLLYRTATGHQIAMAYKHAFDAPPAIVAT
jgi:hypothetical protein